MQGTSGKMTASVTDKVCKKTYVDFVLTTTLLLAQSFVEAE